MPTCPCCGRSDPTRESTNTTYRPRTKCAYCTGYPHSETGQCWGYHGKELEQYLERLVTTGKMERRTMARWLMVDAQRLDTEPGSESNDYLQEPIEVKLPNRYR